MKVRYISHKNISTKQLVEIIKIKTAAWPFSFNEQFKWIHTNLKKDDIHVLLMSNSNNAIAYLNLIWIDIVINDVKSKALGIGNVCALKKRHGHGAKLINEVNYYLVNQELIGLLFCNEKLVTFYENQGWNLISKDSILIIKDLKPNINTLLFNFDGSINKLKYNGKLF